MRDLSKCDCDVSVYRQTNNLVFGRSRVREKSFSFFILWRASTTQITQITRARARDTSTVYVGQIKRASDCFRSVVTL